MFVRRCPAALPCSSAPIVVLKEVVVDLRAEIALPVDPDEPSPFEITATSTGPPTVCRPSDICCWNELRLTSVDATWANSLIVSASAAAAISAPLAIESSSTDRPNSAALRSLAARTTSANSGFSSAARPGTTSSATTGISLINAAASSLRRSASLSSRKAAAHSSAVAVSRRTSATPSAFRSFLSLQC